MPAIRIPVMDLKPQVAPLREQILAAWAKALEQTAFCLGPEVEAFEQEFAQYCGAAHAIGVNSGTSALHVALAALGVGPGDEVLTTPYTFVATSWAVSYCGATPVFADIVPATFNLDPAAAEKALTRKTKAIIAVHLYGQPAQMDALCDLAKRKGLPLIEDAAQAHGAMFQGRRVGTFGTIGCFSFYPSKNLGACGEGGLCTTQDAALAAKLKLLRNHASSAPYRFDELGYNYRMENLQAAALRIKLPHLEGWNERRRAIAARYDELLKDTDVRTPAVGPERSHVYHLYVVRHRQRNALARHLEEAGIGTARHYPVPVHRQPAYAHLDIPEGAFPCAEQAARECLSLPMYPELSDAQVDEVAAAVKAWKP
ncbi:MAG: DegT/DnrJ/EryC1/StrS family aminotransferase [Planctomycetes bacterium]|nr:DegT/DnrJ/EryC1/StrS family aminotransferase [Planctomycetota bacterium]